MNYLLIIIYINLLILQPIFYQILNLVLIFCLHPNLTSYLHMVCMLLFFQGVITIYAKINLKIYYPPPYERLVWDYSKANITNIKNSLSQVNWNNALKDLNVNNQVEYLTSCIYIMYSQISFLIELLHVGMKILLG